MGEEKSKNNTTNIIVTAIAVLIIIFLAFLLYKYSVKPIPEAIQPAALKPIAKPTKIISFLPADILPKTVQNGSCWENSVAYPFRQDAWRCMVENNIIDPCFSAKQDGYVICPGNPQKDEGVAIKLTKPLPKAETPKETQDNWAWFLILKDGTFCSPFTGTRPFFGPDQAAYYGCNSADDTKQILLLNDLEKGNIWKATEAILTKNASGSWTINSAKQADIDTIWQ